MGAEAGGRGGVGGGYPSSQARWAIEHILFPALRTGFLPPMSLAEAGHVLQVADLPELYRIFERC